MNYFLLLFLGYLFACFVLDKIINITDIQNVDYNKLKDTLTNYVDNKNDNTKQHLPSCSQCTLKLNDFCKVDPNCNGNSCEIDPTCNDNVKYSCEAKEFQCNPTTCKDYNELKKNPYWACNKSII